jgi:hypothetical protein
MKVDKDQFDALLSKMMKAQPETAKTIKPDGKASSIIPKPQSTPNKA